MPYVRTIGFLEKIFHNHNIHEFEDVIRYTMLIKGIFTHYDLLLIARILYGRVLNASYSSIDPRHSKSQLITLLCIAFCLSTKKSEMNFKLNRNLFNLLIYHQKIINNFLIETDYSTLSVYDQKHYDFCKELYPYIDILLYKKFISYDESLHLTSLKRCIVEKLPVFNTKSYNLVISNKKFIESLKNVDISIFMTT